MLIFTTDKPRLQRHFEKDKILFSYHLGDLDDFYFPQCQWAAIYQPTRAIIDEVALIYTGCNTPTVQAFGITDRFGGLLDSLVELLPPKFYCHFQSKNRDNFLKHFSEQPLGTFIKMSFKNSQNIDTIDRCKFDIVSLDISHQTELEQLYKSAYPSNYFVPRMLKTKKYFGIFENSKLVSAAGVHVDSDEYKIAVLGNIATVEEFRSQGYGTALTAHLTRLLSDQGKTVCLNVAKDNQSGISVYSKIGFEPVHEYEEALMTLK